MKLLLHGLGVGMIITSFFLNKFIGPQEAQNTALCGIATFLAILAWDSAWGKK